MQEAISHDATGNLWTRSSSYPRGAVHPMAYDVQSDRIVLFGGLTSLGPAGVFLDHTWAYDFESNMWTNLTPPSAPAPRYLHALAYDVQSDRIVLFGGFRSLGVDVGISLDDTWSYDLESNIWTNLTPPIRPSARYAHALAYDIQSDRIIMFGGVDGGVLLNDTWAYDFESNVWTNLTPPSDPGARQHHAMAYDAQSDRIILFSGMFEGGSNPDNTWSYDFEANVWTVRPSFPNPSGRQGHAMAYDSQSDRVILFGGSRAAAILDDTWVYDFEASLWTRLSPPTRPAARVIHALAYDSESDRVILFGGSSISTLFDDTWTYDLEANRWTTARRDGHAIAYDAQSDRIVLFGGLTDAGYRDDTWVYDANQGTWTDVTSPIRPPPMSSLGMAYDAQSDRIILFGGFGGDPASYLDGTWTYDVESSTWTDMVPSTRPQPRFGHAMAYDAESDRVILFGGFTELSGEVADTWAYDFDTNTWTNMNPVASPSSRFSHALAYDAESDRIVLFGGLHLSFGLSDETWSYDFNANTWTNMDPSVRPPARDLHAMVYDALSDRSVVFSGVVAAGVRNDTWSYDLNSNTWTDMAPATQPEARSGHAMAYDAESDRTVLFGGGTVSGRRDDTWSYHHPNRPSAPQSLRADAGNAQVTLRWLPPASDGDALISAYRIYRGPSPGGETLLTTVGDVVTYTEAGLTNGVTYYYQVSASNAIGEGPRSNEVAATPSPTADTTDPSIVIGSPVNGATLTTASVTVSGTASDNVAVERVDVSIDGASWGAATGTTTWSASLVLPGGPNTIYARATDTSGRIATTSVSVTVATPGAGEGIPAPVLIGVAAGGAATVAIGLFALWRRRRRKGETGKPPA